MIDTRTPAFEGVGAISLSSVLDAAFAEFPRSIHPVALFGRLVAEIDRERRFPRLVGVLATACLPLAAAGVAGGLVAVADRRSRALGTLAATGVLFSTSSRRMLTDTARAVVADSRTRLPRARRDLGALAGRDSTTLSAGQVRSAAVESAGENLADGFVAPLLAFTIFAFRSIPAAAGAAAWVKAVNTMDSMLGYRFVPTGWASARLDDGVMWVPARISALSLALAAANPRALGEAARWARAPPSPNSGWPMATLAVLLGVRLEKPDVYVLNPDAELPTAAEARSGISLVDRAALLVVLSCSMFLAFFGREPDSCDLASHDARFSEHSIDDRREPLSNRLSDLLNARWSPWS